MLLAPSAGFAEERATCQPCSRTIASRIMHRLVRGALFLLAATTALSSAAHPQSSQAVNPANPANTPLRPGDRVLVKVWLDTLFADTVRIDETGAAIFPRLGALPVTDMPASAVADSVRSAYSRIVRTPSIEVTPLRRVTILGEVNRPGTYFLETRSTLREAIGSAGGMTNIAVVSHLTVMRDSVRTVVKGWQKRIDPSQIIASGDVVWVDREAWIKQNIFSVISGLGVLFSVLYTATR
jgi:protein involved in polysaccharide export with SLBB domain